MVEVSIGLDRISEKEEVKEIDSPDLVDDRAEPIISNPKPIHSTTTGSMIELAKEEKIGRRLYSNAVKTEQREKFLKSLVELEVGTNRVESNQLRSRGELKWDSGRRVKEIVKEMELKTKDAKKNAKKARWERDRWRKEVENCTRFSRNQVEKMINGGF